MRIGIVSEYVRPWPGGISEHVHHEARELSSRGHEVVVLTGPGDASDDGVRTLRLGREVVFTSNGARSRVSLDASLTRLARRLRDERFDVLHVHAPLDPVLPLAAVLAAPCPVVGTFHASFRPALTWHALYRVLHGVTGRAMDKLALRIAVSDEAERSIARYFPGAYAILPNGVDCRRFTPHVPPHRVLRSAAKTVLFVGRADPRKGLRCLLQAFAEVRGTLRDARLLLVGITAQQLARLSTRAQREGVEALGYVAPSELPSLYAVADVVCAPSTHGESQGLVLLEAMASGKPVVCFDIPGYRDVVEHGVDGWLVESPQPAALARALVRWLDDVTLRQRAGRAARAKAERFDWPRVIDAFERHLDGVVGTKPQRANARHTSLEG